jgi:hypothetical protein
MTLYKGARMIYMEDESLVDVYTFVLPFIDQMVYFSIANTFCQRAAKIWFFLKLLLAIYYILVLILEYRSLAMINLFVAPFVFVIWQILLIFGKL